MSRLSKIDADQEKYNIAIIKNKVIIFECVK